MIKTVICFIYPHFCHVSVFKQWNCPNYVCISMEADLVVCPSINSGVPKWKKLIPCTLHSQNIVDILR